MRPITILCILLKLYMMLMTGIMQTYVSMPRNRFHSSVPLGKPLEWSLPLVIISLDIYKAYDSLCLLAVIGILDHYEIPLQLKYAFLREVLATKKLKIFYSGSSFGYILVNKCFRQGSPEASFVFAIIVAHLLLS